MENPVVESLPKGSIASTKETLIHVLHVDDDAGYLKTAKSLLEMQGAFNVETALSVEEAIEKMEEKKFDVIVCDYIMPGKDGLEFLKELRESQNNIPFIIFTGKGREIVAIKALNLGADQYVNKIGKPEAIYSELAHGIRTVVKGRKAEEELMEWVTANTAAGLAIISKDFHILWANRLLTEYLGDIKGKVCYSTLNNLTNVCPGCGVKEILETGKNKVVHKQVVPGLNGKKVWLQITAIPIRDKNGNIIAISEMAIDITERKKVEEALRESEEKCRELLNGMNDTAWVIDFDGNIVDVNDAAVEVLGYSREELLSIGLTGIDSNLDPEEIKALAKGVPADEIQVFETAHTTKDGKKIPVEISSSLVTY